MQRSQTATPPQARVAHLEATGSKRGLLSRLSSGRPRIALVGGVAALVAISLLTLAYNISQQGYVFRGVKVLGQDLSGLTRAQAQRAVSEASAGYPNGQLALSGNGRSWTFTPADLGVAVDVDKTVDAAMAVGRDGNLLGNLGAQLGAFVAGTQLAPVLKSDSSLVDKAVASVASQVDKPAVDSKLEQGNDGTVRIAPSAYGSVVDRGNVRAAILASVATEPFAPVNLSMRDAAPAITEDALKASQARAELLTQQAVVLSAGDRSWTLSPNDLRGMLALGPGQNGQTISLDNNALAAYLQPIADKLRVDPQDATVVIGNGTVTLTPDKTGSSVDMPAAIAAIQQAAGNQDSAQRTVALPIKEVPAGVRTADVQAVYDKANSLVTQGVRLRFLEDGYILRGSSVTGFIDVSPSQGGPGPLKLVVDQAVLANRVSGVAYNINRKTSDARFKIVNGVPTKVADGLEGYKVNVDKSVQNALAAIDGYQGGDRLQVDLDVTVTQPNLKDADLSNINTPDLLGSGQTSYAGSSPERAWNVELGAKNIDGSLVPPGGVFSTVDAIGDLTLAAGFKMGYAIVTKSDGSLTTVPAEAGGICQVATTLYHSVFWAGLPIVERNWHSYWISLYGVPPSGIQGLDATIAPPEKDFRFKNTTGNWLLIKSSSDGKTLSFKIYGVNPGWKVKVDGPVITNVVKTDPTMITEYNDQLPAGKTVLVEHAQDGFDATIVRTVTDAAGNVIDKWVAKSHYEPAHNRTLIGTGK